MLFDVDWARAGVWLYVWTDVWKVGEAHGVLECFGRGVDNGIDRLKNRKCQYPRLGDSNIERGRFVVLSYLVEVVES